MGLSSGKKTKTKSNSTATVAPNALYAGNIGSAANAIESAYPVAQANNAALMPRVASVGDFYADTMNGKYLGGNPHLDKIIASTNSDIGNQVDSRFALGGRYGSGAHQGILAKALAENEARLRYGDYATERGYQDAAGGRVLQGATIQAALPQMASSTYADAIAALLGKYTTGTEAGTSTTKESGGLLGQLLAAGAQAAGAYAASDRRLKRDIEKIGELDDGLGIYVWRYIWGKLGVGVMADEVAEKRPWALGPTFHGFATVNYGAL